MEKRLAIFFDCENISPKYVEALMGELASEGEAIIKRAYGDWSSNHLKNWKKTMNELVIQPIQQFSYTQGKNSSDAALIIDAMDLLYSGKFDAFAIVSSDSDFTPLASRLKESQIHVYGVGEKKTPSSFKNACDDFIYVEVLRELDAEDDESKSPKAKAKTKTKDIKNDTKLINLLRNAMEDCADEDGWAALAECGGLIKKQLPDFDPRNYGYTKLSTLIQDTNLFEMWKKTIEHSGKKVIFFRDTKNYGER